MLLASAFFHENHGVSAVNTRFDSGTKIWYSFAVVRLHCTFIFRGCLGQAFRTINSKSMSNRNRILLLLILVCLALTAMPAYFMGWLNPDQIQAFIRASGLWAPLLFVALYVLATSFLLPSTPVNVSGGILFGFGFGMLWTAIAAIVAAVITFALARTLGRTVLSEKLARRWPALDAEVRRGAKSYMFAVRLLPIIPNGLVNYGAGVTSISFRDYMIGTVPGTILGILPPVLIGSSGVRAIKTHEVLPLVLAMALMGLLVGGATWYRQRRGLSDLSEG
jgi:uncharacterized membrane protein YdjX (TVP38/TMEM64 family)